uniref:Uncharacterized protein n=1 Tax=Tanacetum cinerariifolium TaxID=118510 RepID=A0A6L2NAE3_TANCI|nr:hypothetical protein [Tanacetum cinerariifolium]
MGSMKLALVEIRLVEITTLVLIKSIPPIEIVLIILNGRESRRSNLICNHLSGTVLVRVSTTAGNTIWLTALTGVGVGDGAGAEDWFFLSRCNALTISLSLATSDEIDGVEELEFTLATTGLARGKNWLMNLDTRSSQVRIDRGCSFSSQIRAAPSSENGKSISLIVKFDTFGTLIVEPSELLVDLPEIDLLVMGIQYEEVQQFYDGIEIEPSGQGICWEVMEDRGRSSGSGGEGRKRGRNGRREMVGNQGL